MNGRIHAILAFVALLSVASTSARAPLRLDITRLGAGLPIQSTLIGTTFTVDSEADVVDAHPGDGTCATASGACTLRAAVQEANAWGGDDIIILPPGQYALSIAGTGEDAQAGDLNLSSTLTLSGADPDTTIIDAQADTLDDWVLTISAGSQVTVSGVTVRGGHPLDPTPSGIRNSGTLTISNSTVMANVGAGIDNRGILTVLSSTIRENYAGVISSAGKRLAISNSTVTNNWYGISSAGPAAVANSLISGNRILGIGNSGSMTVTASTISNNVLGISNWGTLTVLDSTISGNGAPYRTQGGGIHNYGNEDGAGQLTLANSTITGNGTIDDGGGIWNLSDRGYLPAPMTLNNVTITNNTADADRNGYGDGGGIANWAGTVINLKNSILAGNIDPGGQVRDCLGTITSLGYNLIERTSGCTILGTTTGNITGQSAWLAPLQNAGGPTSTHPLRMESPALNAGSPDAPGAGSSCEASDQRGVMRPAGAACDIGAFEGHVLLSLFPFIVR